VSAAMLFLPQPPPPPVCKKALNPVGASVCRWRISLAGAGIPALMLLLAGGLLPDSPSSLAERGRPEAARAVLQRVRGKRGARTPASVMGIKSGIDASPGSGSQTQLVAFVPRSVARCENCHRLRIVCAFPKQEWAELTTEGTPWGCPISALRACRAKSKDIAPPLMHFDVNDDGYHSGQSAKSNHWNHILVWHQP
jgi:hypothetical protein